MTEPVALLAATAATVAVLHTLVGPDHYLPFIALGRARGWSGQRTLAVTAACGVGHVLGSVALGAVGIALGVALSRLQALEAARGDLAAWLLIAVGLAYGAWGWRRAVRSSRIRGLAGHRHAPPPRRGEATPWVLFAVFVLGPCEPLIPLLMVPAAQGDPAGAVAVAGVFGLVTIATMVGAVAFGRLGVGLLPFGRLERYGHALAGASILLCGLGIRILGI